MQAIKYLTVLLTVNAFPRSHIFKNLELWIDDEPRSGAMNMAIDQLLMERVGDHPILRVYHWSEPTVSFGYFMAMGSAKAAFSDEGLRYVRRWTGGGIVDHRNDITYTLALPRTNNLAQSRGGESYRVIHQALADALIEMNKNVTLLCTCASSGGDTCFTSPVTYDLLDQDGRKVAGAGQRRTKYGLLHQGSVSIAVNSEEFAHTLASSLANKFEIVNSCSNLLRAAVSLAEDRYGSKEWLMKK
ncbi:MAG: lipoate--protein ligase family protein [Akkermansiaceae bacterium]